MTDKVRKPRHPKSPTGDTFCSSFKPIRPDKPQKILLYDTPLTDWTVRSYDSLSSEDLEPLIELINRGDKFRLEIEVDTGDYLDDPKAYMTLYSAAEQPNPNYESQMKDYKEDYQIYKAELAWWKKCKKAQDEYDKTVREQRELKQYEKLKEKFGE